MSDPVTVEHLNNYCGLRHDPLNKSIDKIDGNIIIIFNRLNRIYLIAIAMLCTMVANLAVVLIVNNAYKTTPKIEVKIDKTLIQELTLKRNPGTD